MEKESVLASKIHHGHAPRFYLKVNIQCCSACRRRAKEKLQKFPGVLAITIDTEQGLVAVTGTVDPQIVIKKFAKWGKKAVLCSPQKDPAKGDSSDCSCCEDDSDSECECDRNHDEKVSQSQKMGPIGDPLPNVSNSNASTKKSKKLGCLLGLFSKLKEAAKPKLQDVGVKLPLGAPPVFRPNNMQAPGNVFSLGMSAMPYGASRPHYPPYWERPQYGSQYRGPTVYGSPAMLPYPHHIQPMYPPPVLQPSVFFQSRPPPQFRPMIHYSRYEDNYV